MDQQGNILIHKNIPTDADTFLALIKPYQEDIVIGVECLFCWYWLADLCAQHNITFKLGHALYMKCIHGGKAKNDKIDSEKITRLLLGKNFPVAYVYPVEMRPIRDLLRRRTTLVHFSSTALAHIKITNYQYNLPAFEKQIRKKGNRQDVAERFTDPGVRKNVETDLAVVEHLHENITDIEAYVVRHAIHYNPRVFYRLQTVPGIGKIISLTLLYEIQDINRFPSVQDFCSYARLVKCAKESAGKHYGYSGAKIGNAHLKWAFSEAAALFLRNSDRAKAYMAKLTKKHGKGKAMAILSHKLGRAIFYMLKRQDAFDEKYFFRTV